MIIRPEIIQFETWAWYWTWKALWTRGLELLNHWM